MTQLLTMALDDNSDSLVVFEVAEHLVGDELELAAGDGSVLARARVSLDEALGQVKPALSRVVESVRGLGSDELEVTFGLKVGGDTSVIIAKGTAEVNFAVRLLWKKA